MNEVAHKSKILWINDGDLSREQQHALRAMSQTLDKTHKIFFKPEVKNEDEIIKILQSEKFSLTLLPVKLYCEYKRVEGFWGVNRTQGPLVAGYTFQPFNDSQFKFEMHYPRSLFLNFSPDYRQHTLKWIKLLSHEDLKSGLIPMYPKGTIFHKDIFSSSDIDLFYQSIREKDFWDNDQWKDQDLDIRICLESVKEMIFNKMNFGQSTSEKRAAIQAVADSESIAFRACFTQNSWKTPKDIIPHLWFSYESKSPALSSLQRYSDWAKIIQIADSKNYEFCFGHYLIKKNRSTQSKIKTLWVDALDGRRVTETYSPEKTNKKYIVIENETLKPKENPNQKKLPDPEIIKTLNLLKNEVAQQKKLIQELKSGGIGTNFQFSPLTGIDLLDQFEEKLNESRYQYLELLNQFKSIQNTPSSLEFKRLEKEIKNHKKEMQNWFEKLSKIVLSFKSLKKASGE
ncbi:MAG: hypothetical protein CL678_09715 [Bdellovibrionaceae bacterium]|nr:hypothetical protein [Pseudobdellovibrionaceae bacterium]